MNGELEEFILTDKQFEEIMTETIKEMFDRMMLFAVSPKEHYLEIAKEYKEIHDSYKKILKGYRRRKKIGIEVTPTLTFNHLEGMMQPGYRHKMAITRYDEWYKMLKKRDNGKVGVIWAEK